MDNAISLSASAAARIKFLAQKQEKPALALRLMVESGGCSGFQYKFSLEDVHPGKADMCIQRDGAEMRIDKVSADFLKGAEVDFKSDLSGEMFVVKNPNAESACGCGSSFMVKP